MDKLKRIICLSEKMDSEGNYEPSDKMLILAMNEFDPEYVDIANKTSRGCGSVGSNAIVPRLIREIATPNDTILDFGAGKEALHAKKLRDEGLNVTAYDFGRNVQDGIHDPDALNPDKKYSIVYASNVANVQSSVGMLQKTLNQIYSALAPGGTVILNLPSQPRKCEDITPSLLFNELVKLFGEGSVSKIRKMGDKNLSTPIFKAEKSLGDQLSLARNR